MSTDIEITSNALLLIGDNPITAWNDNSAGETVSEDMYLRTKNEVLSHYPWSFAKKIQELDLILFGYEVTSSTVVDRVNEATGGDNAFVNEKLKPEIFDSVNDYILIGSDDKFEVIRVFLDAVADVDCELDFYYSKAGNNWTALTVLTENTSGFRNTGDITFDAPADWTADDQAEIDGDITNQFYIKIERTAVTVTTLPTVKKFKFFDDRAIPQVTNFQYAHRIPTDMLRLWSVLPIRGQYIMVGNKLVSNSLDLWLEYIWSIPEAVMPDWFVTALEYKLASKFAQSITENAGTSKQMYELYLRHVGKASNIDSQAHPQQQMASQPFTDVRLAGSSGGWYGTGSY